MNATSFLAVLGGLLALAFVANRLFRLTRVPDVIVLLAVGLFLGPVSGWLQPAPFRPITDTLGTLALILILFEGGLDLNLRDTLRLMRVPSAVECPSLCWRRGLIQATNVSARQLACAWSSRRARIRNS